jgi:hypothetical protein
MKNSMFESEGKKRVLRNKKMHGLLSASVPDTYSCTVTDYFHNRGWACACAAALQEDD